MTYRIATKLDDYTVHDIRVRWKEDRHEWRTTVILRIFDDNPSGMLHAHLRNSEIESALLYLERVRMALDILQEGFSSFDKEDQRLFDGINAVLKGDQYKGYVAAREMRVLLDDKDPLHELERDGLPSDVTERFPPVGRVPKLGFLDAEVMKDPQSDITLNPLKGDFDGEYQVILHFDYVVKSRGGVGSVAEIETAARQLCATMQLDLVWRLEVLSGRADKKAENLTHEELTLDEWRAKAGREGMTLRGNANVDVVDIGGEE